MHPNGVSVHPMSMEDRELYRRILGIENPWRVASVDLQLTPREVHIYLAHEDLPDWPCAECAAPGRLYDHQPERQWRHLDTCRFRTVLHAEPPRSQCPTHGVRVVKLPWAEPSSRFTALFEALAIAWLSRNLLALHRSCPVDFCFSWIFRVVRMMETDQPVEIGNTAALALALARGLRGGVVW
jgi:hypothetical protein